MKFECVKASLACPYVFQRSLHCNGVKNIVIMVGKPCSNCFIKRSFLTLNRVKSYFRSNMKEKNMLAIFNVENGLSTKLEHNNVINIFTVK